MVFMPLVSLITYTPAGSERLSSADEPMVWRNTSLDCKSNMLTWLFDDDVLTNMRLLAGFG